MGRRLWSWSWSWFCGCLLWAGAALADVGTLVPPGSDQPDASIFSLDELHIDVLIDNGVARVRWRQIFGSHANNAPEGVYRFALPARAAVSDFAVWDGLTRIPGVILERREAEAIYEEAKRQVIDPGLLQQGEQDNEAARRNAVFEAKIVPVPAFGTKRVEMEYHENLTVENGESLLAIPLRPDLYQAQTAGLLTVSVEVRDAFSLSGVAVQGYPIQLATANGHLARGTYTGRAVPLAQDLQIRFRSSAPAGQAVQVLTYRDPAVEPVGFWEARALLTGPTEPRNVGPRSVVVLFDASLSMQWEKLERSYQALEALLRSLKPQDRFQLIVFHHDVVPFAGGWHAPGDVDRALAFVKSTNLHGGTALQAALHAGLQAARSATSEVSLVLLSDGGSTEGTIANGKLAAGYEREWQALPAAQRPHTYLFGVGDDANLPLLKLLARQAGLWEWVRSTEPIEFKLQAFLAKLGQRPVEGLAVTSSVPTSLVYPLEEVRYRGGVASWVGQYGEPVANGSFQVNPIGQTTVALPVRDTEHPQLPRLWARARVDALLEKIERDGEDRASIDEIIRLSRRYKFVTPYTSFLAAPRSLLRPRVIRPGDPVLRVRTDKSIVSVTALLPFGEAKALRYLGGEDMWQTRFLAPADLSDGTYAVRLVLRDRQGTVYREAKSIVIVSKPPVVRVVLDKVRYRAGEPVRLRVQASALTRRITAQLPGAMPATLRWSEAAKANVGELLVPASYAAGRYPVRVMAEDIAHNTSGQEVALEVY